MTDDLIEHLTHLLSDASPQPWRVDGDSRRRIAEDTTVRRDIAHGHHLEDVELIVAAVNALPELLDTIRTLTHERDAAIRALENERSSLPKAGLWLVEEQSGGRSMRWIAAGNLPDPLPVAALERHRETMRLAVWDVFDSTWDIDARGVWRRATPSVDKIVDVLIATVRGLRMEAE